MQLAINAVLLIVAPVRCKRMGRFLAVLLGVLVACGPLCDTAYAQTAVERLQSAQAAVGRGELNAALKELEAGIQQDPAYFPLWKQKAVVHALRMEPGPALEAIRVYLSQNPDDAEARLTELNALLQLDRREEFQERFATLDVAAIPDDLLLITALRLYRGKGYGASLDRLLTLAQPEDDAVAAMLEGMELLRQGDADQALARVRDLETDRDTVKDFGGLLAFESGRSLAEAERYDEALQAFRLALALGVDEVGARREIGWTLWRQGARLDAAEQWARVAEHAPDPALWYGWIADAYILAAEWDLALHALDKGLEHAPSDPLLQAKKYQVLTALGDDAALQRYASQLRDDGAVTGLALGEALALRQQGEALHAVRRMREAGLDKRYPDLYREINRLAASSLHAQGRYAEAEVILADLLETDPDDVGLMRDLGWAMWARGKRSHALQLWGAALDRGLEGGPALAEQLVMRMLEVDELGLALTFYRQHLGGEIFSLAWRMRVGDRWDLAQPLFRLAAAEENHPYFSRLYLAEAALHNNDFETAEGTLKAFVSIYAGYPYVDDAPPAAGVDLSAQRAGEAVSSLLGLIALKRQTGLAFFYEHVTDFYGELPTLQAALPHHLALMGAAFLNEGQPGPAARYLEQSLALNPDLPEALLVSAIAFYRMNQVDEGDARLARAEALTPPAALLQRARGERSLAMGRAAEAVAHFRQSLETDPKQVLLRQQLVQTLARQGRVDEARTTAQWFETQFETGDDAVMAQLAESRSLLGDAEGAAALWRELVARNPQVDAYRVNWARLLFATGEAKKALRIIAPVQVGSEGGVTDERAAVLLAEIHMALGRYEDAVAAANRGLLYAPGSLLLLRSKAEAAEQMERYALAEKTAKLYLELNPDDETMQTLLGRALVEQKKYTEAETHYQQLLAHNPSFKPALRDLRFIGQLKGDEALAYAMAKTMMERYPDEPWSRVYLAASAAGRRHFGTAFQMVHELEDFTPSQSLPILYYSQFALSDYPGVMNFEQWERHVRRLHEEGYRFIAADNLVVDHEAGTLALAAGANEDDTAALLVIGRTPAATLLRMDAVLAELGGHALLIVDDSTLTASTAQGPDRLTLQALERGGRFAFGLTDYAPPALMADGELREGEFYHRRRKVDGVPETRDAMAQRVGERMDVIKQAVSFLEHEPRIWFYPDGNYGQLSLHADETAMEANQAAALSHFEVAMALDAEGFLAPTTLAARVPAMEIRPGWSPDRVVERLSQQDPFRGGVLQQGIVYSLSSQYEAANRRFAEAEALGADKRDLYYSWGANAFFQGDVPTALELLRKAQAEDPSSALIAQAVEMAENATKPAVGIAGDYWFDTDDRTYARAAQKARLYALEDLQARAHVAQISWERRDLAHVEAAEVGVGLRYHLAPEYWVDGDVAVQVTDVDNQAVVLGQASLRGPIHLEEILGLNGHYTLQYAHERIDTAEAVQSGTTQHRISLRTNARVADFWDINANGHYYYRTDHNEGWSVDGSVIRRLWENPGLGVGYGFQFANSDTNPEEYYAPVHLSMHLLRTRGILQLSNSTSFTFNSGLGVAQEDGEPWTGVWQADASLRTQLMDELFLDIGGAHVGRPDYEIWRASGEIMYRF